MRRKLPRRFQRPYYIFGCIHFMTKQDRLEPFTVHCFQRARGKYNQTKQKQKTMNFPRWAFQTGNALGWSENWYMNANMFIHWTRWPATHVWMHATVLAFNNNYFIHNSINMSPNTERKTNKFTKVRNNALSHWHLLTVMQSLYSTICGAA